MILLLLFSCATVRVPFVDPDPIPHPSVRCEVDGDCDDRCECRLGTCVDFDGYACEGAPSVSIAFYSGGNR